MEVKNAEPEKNSYLQQQIEAAQHSKLKRELGWVELTSMGLGGTIGAGIFVVTGHVAKNLTGPAVCLSYVVSALTCLFAAFCYAEFASMVPTAGSAYTYAHATMGRLMGWIIGWDLILEYTVSSATVARSWSQHFVIFWNVIFPAKFPTVITNAPFAYENGSLISTGQVFDFPAFCITVIISILLVNGIKESSRFNNIMVVTKVLVVFFVIFVGSAYIDTKNYSPFFPYGIWGFSFFGIYSGGGSTPVGVFAGAAITYFAYIGFDMVTCQVEETKNPERNLPIAVILSLLCSTVLYVAVSVVLVGMVPYQNIMEGAPLAAAFTEKGIKWAEAIISLGALVGMTSVILVTMLGQPRIFMAMARDKMLPSFFGAIHPRTNVPYKSAIVTGVVVCFASSLFPLDLLLELVSIGTLFAFFLVCSSIIVLRRTQPNHPRKFRSPFVPFFPLMGAFLSLMLMFSLKVQNWIRLLVWMAIGFVIYYFYGRKMSPKPTPYVEMEEKVQEDDTKEDDSDGVTNEKNTQSSGGGDDDLQSPQQSQISIDGRTP